MAHISIVILELRPPRRRARGGSWVTRRPYGDVIPFVCSAALASIVVESRAIGGMPAHDQRAASAALDATRR